MKVVQVTEEQFDELFEEALKDLELQQWIQNDHQCNCQVINAQKPITAIHRRFVYVVLRLKDKILNK